MAKPQLITRQQLDQAELLFRTGEHSIADVKRKLGSSSSKIDRLAHALGIFREVRSREAVAEEKDRAVALLKEGKTPKEVADETGILYKNVQRYRREAKLAPVKAAYKPRQLELIVKQLNGSMSLREMAETLQVSATTLYNAELRMGVVRNRKKAAPVNEKRRQMTEETMHLTVTEAAKKMGCSRTVVYYYRSKRQCAK